MRKRGDKLPKRVDDHETPKIHQLLSIEFNGNNDYIEDATFDLIISLIG